MRKVSPAAVALLLVALAAAGATLWLRLVRAGRGNELGPAFVYDLGSLQDVDPAQMIGTEAAPVPVGVPDPRGIAVGPGNRIYVAGSNAVAVLAGGAAAGRSFPIEGAGRCLAVDRDGTVYVGLRDRVVVHDAGGRAVASWPPLGTHAVLTSIGLADEDVFVADAGNRVVLRYDRQGALRNRIGEKDPGRGVPGFVIPSPYFDLAVARDGALWVVDPGRHRFVNFSADGDSLASWERSGMAADGFCGCCNPTHFAMRADGSFVTSEKGIVRVKIHDRAGTLVGVVAAPARFDADTVGLDLAVDEEGRILVLDPKRKQVMVFVVP